MVYRLLIGIGLTVLGYYVGQQVERDAPIRERLRKRREEKQQALSNKEHKAPPR